MYFEWKKMKGGVRKIQPSYYENNMQGSKFKRGNFCFA
ncbi:hypothetical protein X474_03375 [Dethiosulfatarculus sandiegensis]|uniref:Uncharacterized protein n=1 Tax=Dethiosulfatarculus sandiegensis TaxID=1429043 RepID=A0A0D2HYK1_9BACT|nr:hypothetical protein X474_03375 [Dethiosulfatarculus sandiegensis]